LVGRLLCQTISLILLQNRFVTKKSPEALQQPRSPVTQAIPVNMKKKAKAMMQQRLK
jgi:hypothetical protein